MSTDTFFLNELKIALINEDIEKLKELSKKTPKFSSIEEAKEIKSLLEEVNIFLKNKKLETFQEMQKIKKMKKFQESKENQKFDFKG